LDNLEWRDIERTVAEVFDGLGFKVTLTPPAKDGGKDIILSCHIHGKNTEYYVEIKHWRSRKKVGPTVIRDFLNVVVREKREGGLFLTTYGYSEKAMEQFSRIKRQQIYLGDQTKVVNLCKHYVNAKNGLWSPPNNIWSVISDE
jgi:restriction system protein